MTLNHLNSRLHGRFRSFLGIGALQDRGAPT